MTTSMGYQAGARRPAHRPWAIGSRAVVSALLLLLFLLVIVAIRPTTADAADEVGSSVEGAADPPGPEPSPGAGQPTATPTAAPAAAAPTATPAAAAPPDDGTTGTGTGTDADNGFVSEGSIGGQAAGATPGPSATPGPAGTGTSAPVAQTQDPDAVTPAAAPTPATPQAPDPTQPASGGYTADPAAVTATGILDQTLTLDSPEHVPLPQPQQPTTPAGTSPASVTPTQTPVPTPTPTPTGGIEALVPNSQTRMLLTPPVPTTCAGSPCPPGQPGQPAAAQIPPGVRPEDQYDARATSGFTSIGLSADGWTDPAAGERGRDQQQMPTEGQEAVFLAPASEATEASDGQREFMFVTYVYHDGAWAPDPDRAEFRMLTAAQVAALQQSRRAPAPQDAPPEGATPSPTPAPGPADPPGPGDGDGDGDGGLWELSPDFIEFLDHPDFSGVMSPRALVFTAVAMPFSVKAQYHRFLNEGLTKEQALRRALEYQPGSIERDAFERGALDYDVFTNPVLNVIAKSAIMTAGVTAERYLNRGVTWALAPAQLDRVIGPLKARVGPQSGLVMSLEKAKGLNLNSGLSWWNIPLQATMIYASYGVVIPWAGRVGLDAKPTGYNRHGQPLFANNSDWWLHYGLWEGLVGNGLPASAFGLEAFKQGVTKAALRSGGRTAGWGGLLYWGLSVGSNFATNPPPEGWQHEVGTFAGHQLDEFNRVRLNPDPQNFDELTRSATINHVEANLRYGWDYFNRNLGGALPMNRWTFGSSVSTWSVALQRLALSGKVATWEFGQYLIAKTIGDEEWAARQVQIAEDANHADIHNSVSAETQAAVDAANARADQFNRLAMSGPLPTDRDNLSEYFWLNAFDWLGSWGSELDARWPDRRNPPNPAGVVEAQVRRQGDFERLARAWDASWGGTPTMTEELRRQLEELRRQLEEIPTVTPPTTEEQQRIQDELRRQLQGIPTVGPTPPASP